MIAFLFYDLAFQFINYIAEEFYGLNELRQNFLLVEGAGIFLGGSVAKIGFTYVKRFRSSFKTILIFSLALFSVFLIPLDKGTAYGRICDRYYNTSFIFFCRWCCVSTIIWIYLPHKVTPHETGLLFGIMEGIEIFAEGAISLMFFFGNLKTIT